MVVRTNRDRADMTDALSIRRGTAVDHVALGQVMFDAVRQGPSRYTPEQQAAWVPEPRRGADWDARLAAQTIFIAEQDGQPVGFMTLAPPDYVDFAYIRPAWQGKGVFRHLHDALEQEARTQGQSRLHVHASLMAQPAFEAMGYAITAPEEVEISGLAFRRFAMEKRFTR